MIGRLHEVPEPPWFHEWMRAAIKRRDPLVRVHSFIEAVIMDDESYEAGLWQGDMPVSAMRAFYEAVEQIRSAEHSLIQEQAP